MRFLDSMTAMSAALYATSAAPSSRFPRTTNTNMTAANPATNTTVYSFADTCKPFSLYQHGEDVWLSGYCRDKSGAWPYAKINLNHCIANDMGKMEAREDGYFGQTCNRMGFHGSHAVIWGFCSNGHYPVETAIDVGTFVDNDDGRLHCFGYYSETI
ncbi:hypothetical protein F4823DRAFT_560804 [Ustulina deusta]|nr:hypothetical protein F4823DRAFT_560804 [Ustulina deusta]